jgi:hypothetical protein
MAAIFKALVDGELRETKARRFSHYIGSVRHWFALHDGINHVGQAVSHWESGKLVRPIPPMFQAACRGDAKAAAKMTLDKLVESVGADRVNSVLNAAEKGAA